MNEFRFICARLILYECVLKVLSVTERHIQINKDIILFSNRQFDSLFDTTYTVIGMKRAHA